MTKLPMQNKFFRYEINNTKEMNGNLMEKLRLQPSSEEELKICLIKNILLINLLKKNKIILSYS